MVLIEYDIVGLFVQFQGHPGSWRVTQGRVWPARRTGITRRGNLRTDHAPGPIPAAGSGSEGGMGGKQWGLSAWLVFIR